MISLIDLYRQHQGKVSDKWSVYLDEYDRLFSGIKKNPVRILEIGIQNGGSLELWSKYFPNSQVIVGCDINSNCSELTFDDPRIQIVIGDANTDTVEKDILNHSKSFDIIIDDGSHKSSDITKSFSRYFRHLNYGGIFFVEDLHCSYWNEFEGGLYFPYSSMAFFKRLADIVNYEHWGIKKDRRQLLQGFSDKLSIVFDDNELANIHSIEFFNSACVVRKLKTGSNSLGKRVVAGQQELVMPGILSLPDRSLTLSQEDNIWTTMNSAPEEAWQQHIAELSERDCKIAKLNQAVDDRESQISGLNQAVDDRESQIASLKNEINAVLNSTSWKLTRPLRFVGHQFARGKHLFKIAPLAFRIGGGPSATLKKAIIRYRKEGFSGIRRGIRIVQEYSANKPAESIDYQSWCQTHEPRPNSYPDIRHTTENWKFQPEISVVVPTYNTPKDFLVDAIDSVLDQAYPHWQLCICDDASTKPHVREVLKHYADRDSRICFVALEENGNISLATNKAISEVTSDYMTFLDHDDKLHPLALYYLAEAIVTNENADMWYSDEDKLDYDGKRSQPFFKPDWSPHLALSQAYLGHLVCYRSTLVREIGGCRTGYDGAQDYDLWLRASLKARSIVHIPKILYHWRMHAESTSTMPSAKPYAHEAGLRALQDYVSLRYPKTPVKVVDGYYTFTYGQRFRLPTDTKVSIIIPTRDRVDLLRSCIDSIIEKSSWQNIEILVLDNRSSDPDTLVWLNQITMKDPRVRVISADIPFNWSRLNNIGASKAAGKVLIFLNNDTMVISPDWIEKLAGFALLPDVGIAGALLLFEDGTIQHSGVVVGMGGWADHIYRTHSATHHSGPFISPVMTRNSLAVTGACAAITAERFNEIGGFDEEFMICGSDVELCLRSHAHGWYNVMVGDARLFHFESKSRDPAKIPQRDFEQSACKYEPFRTQDIDPYFNPNLSLATTTPMLENRSIHHA